MFDKKISGMFHFLTQTELILKTHTFQELNHNNLMEKFNV